MTDSTTIQSINQAINAYANAVSAGNQGGYRALDPGAAAWQLHGHFGVTAQSWGGDAGHNYVTTQPNATRASADVASVDTIIIEIDAPADVELTDDVRADTVRLTGTRLRLAMEAGFPAPSRIVASGNKSLHVAWVVSPAITLEQGREGFAAPSSLAQFYSTWHQLIAWFGGDASMLRLGQLTRSPSLPAEGRAQPLLFCSDEPLPLLSVSTGGSSLASAVSARMENGAVARGPMVDAFREIHNRFEGGMEPGSAPWAVDTLSAAREGGRRGSDAQDYASGGSGHWRDGSVGGTPEEQLAVYVAYMEANGLSKLSSVNCAHEELGRRTQGTAFVRRFADGGAMLSCSRATCEQLDRKVVTLRPTLASRAQVVPTTSPAELWREWLPNPDAQLIEYASDLPYLPGDPLNLDDYRITCLHASMGTGKTYVTQGWFETMRDMGYERVSLIHRKSLAASHAIRLHLNSYINHLRGGERYGDALPLSVVITPNSFRLIDFRAYEGTDYVVFCDEWTQVLRSLTSNLNKGGDRKAQFGRIRRFLRGACHIIAADALMTPRALNDLTNLAGVEASAVQVRYLRKATTISYTVTSKKAFLTERIFKALDANKKISVGSTSVSYLRGICDMIENDYPHKQMKLIIADTYNPSSPTAEEAEEAALIRQELDVDGFNQYDAVLFSPTWGTGIDVPADKYTPDVAFGYISSGSCPADDALQLIHRVRSIAENKMLLCVLPGGARGANLVTATSLAASDARGQQWLVEADLQRFSQEGVGRYFDTEEIVNEVAYTIYGQNNQAMTASLGGDGYDIQGPFISLLEGYADRGFVSYTTEREERATTSEKRRASRYRGYIKTREAAEKLEWISSVMSARLIDWDDRNNEGVTQAERSKAFFIQVLGREPTEEELEKAGSKKGLSAFIGAVTKARRWYGRTFGCKTDGSYSKEALAAFEKDAGDLVWGVSIRDAAQLVRHDDTLEDLLALLIDGNPFDGGEIKSAEARTVGLAGFLNDATRSDIKDVLGLTAPAAPVSNKALGKFTKAVAEKIGLETRQVGRAPNRRLALKAPSATSMAATLRRVESSWGVNSRIHSPCGDVTSLIGAVTPQHGESATAVQVNRSPAITEALAILNAPIDGEALRDSLPKVHDPDYRLPSRLRRGRLPVSEATEQE